MTNTVIPTPFFSKKAKRLIKKFHTLRKSIEELAELLLLNPRMGDSYGHNIYKVRLADESKGKGKSGGFRVITYLIEQTDCGTDIYLIHIIDKSEEDTITKSAVKDLITKIGL